LRQPICHRAVTLQPMAGCSPKYRRNLRQHRIDDRGWNAFQLPAAAPGEIESAWLAGPDNSRRFVLVPAPVSGTAKPAVRAKLPPIEPPVF
jgi:hypothetical protein